MGISFGLHSIGRQRTMVECLQNLQAISIRILYPDKLSVKGNGKSVEILSDMEGLHKCIPR